MHLKVILQGELGTFTSSIYASASEFRELFQLIDRREIEIASPLDAIGKYTWPELDVVLCNFWCRAPDIDAESLKFIRRDKLLEASLLVERRDFLSRSNQARCDWLFHRALTSTADGFRKFGHRFAEIEAIRDQYISEAG